MSKKTTKQTYQLKWRETLEKFCPKCEHWLVGNGSVAHPYMCLCGEWGYDQEKQDYYLLA